MKVSVITPAFNSAWCLPDYMASVAAQTRPPDEILIGVDACETTLAAALELKQKYTEFNIRVLYFKEHAGCYRIRNTLALLAAGDVLCLFDADDTMHSDHIASMLHLSAPDTYVVAAGTLVECEGHTVVRQGLAYRKCHGVVCVYRDLFLRHCGYEAWPCSADSEFIIRIKAAGVRIVTSQVSTMTVRKHKDSLTRNNKTGMHTRLRHQYKAEYLKRKTNPVVLKTLAVAICVEVAPANTAVVEDPVTQDVEATEVTEVTPVYVEEQTVLLPTTPLVPRVSMPSDPAPIDVVLPLGGQSIYNNLELRLALRSMAMYLLNIGEIYIVSDSPPAWLQNVQIISFPDLFSNNKDANIIDKISKACQTVALSENFLFWSDDQVLLKPVLANDIGPTAEPTDAIQHFQQNSVGWRGRMHRTGIKLQRMGKNTINFDAHVPQPMNKKLFRKMLRTVPDYIEDMPGRINGYCINTLYFNLFGIKPAALRPDNGIKVMQPIEVSVISKGLEDKVWCGYNNVGFTGPLRKMLEQRFQERCMYEKY